VGWRRESFGNLWLQCVIARQVSRAHRRVGWVDRNNSGSKIAQFAGKSSTQPPQRLLFVMGIPQPASKTLIDKTTNLLPIVVASSAGAIFSVLIGNKLITHLNKGAKQLLTSRVPRFSLFFAFPPSKLGRCSETIHDHCLRYWLFSIVFDDALLISILILSLPWVMTHLFVNIYL